MDHWIEMYNYREIKIHRNNRTIIIEEGKSITMLVYGSENDAIFASLGMLIYFEEKYLDPFADE